jgi:beta-glucosidase
MPPSDFATANIDKVLNDLTTAEAILLTAGEGLWYTQSVDRLGIPAIKVWSMSLPVS